MNIKKLSAPILAMAGSVKSWCLRHKKLLITLGILLILYLVIPMASRAMYPGVIFQLDPERVTAIELHDEYGNFITIEDKTELSSLTDQLNRRRYIFWRFDMNILTDCSYGMTVYYGIQHQSYILEENWIQDGLIFYTDMEFITDYFQE